MHRTVVSLLVLALIVNSIFEMSYYGDMRRHREAHVRTENT